MLTTSPLTLTDADIDSLYEEKNKKYLTIVRGDHRIKQFADVLNRDKYNDEQRDAAARWFVSITRATGTDRRSLSTLKKCAETIGVSATGKRPVVERALLLHPGL
jgi:hypothetical protein